jgi:hypothetical protein
MRTGTVGYKLTHKFIVRISPIIKRDIRRQQLYAYRLRLRNPYQGTRLESDSLYKWAVPQCNNV